MGLGDVKGGGVLDKKAVQTKGFCQQPGWSLSEIYLTSPFEGVELGGWLGSMILHGLVQGWTENDSSQHTEALRGRGRGAFLSSPSRR